MACFSGVGPQQVRQWISLTTDLITKILNNQSTSEADNSIAWIRVYEILESLPGYFWRYNELNSQLSQFSNAEMIKSIKNGKAVLEKLDELNNALSEEDFIVIEYERHCNAHIFQSGYRKSVRLVKGEIKNRKFEYKERSIDEIDKIVTARIRSHKINEVSMLKEIISKIYPLILQLNELVQKWAA